MADAFRGLTLRIGADTRPLQSAISSITRSASHANKQLNAMNKALKLDPTNISAMASRIDLVRDKAAHSARAAMTLRTAMGQASDETRKLADNTALAYAKTQTLNAQYNHVNASLQQVYDAMARVVMRQGEITKADGALASVAKRLLGLTDTGAAEYVKKLREQLNGTEDEARQAAEALKELVDNATEKDAVAHVKKLREQMNGTGEAARKAKAAFKALLTTASETTGINSALDRKSVV